MTVEAGGGSQALSRHPLTLPQNGRGGRPFAVDMAMCLPSPRASATPTPAAGWTWRAIATFKGFSANVPVTVRDT